MKRILLVLGMVTLLSGCNTIRQYEPLPVADTRVDLDRFMGKWYVIGSVPTVFDRKPYNAVEFYERAERGIKITYQFNSDKSDGQLRTIHSQAMVDNPGINTDWEVTYAWPIKGDYKIIHLEPDYSVAVVGHPNRKNVWILARQPSISAPLYSDLILQLQQLGFNVGLIRLVPHS